ncbi:hypothetical protein XENOCAPTIV_019611 [Xenoophorus captivus]|uniref:Uncharacterized protein n=1 Tax=Xenoophorus captivus TaxID=1517983 RepID=A0ABV0QSM7_9TELE
MSTNARLAVGLGLGAVLLTLDSGAFHLRWEFTGLRGAAEGIVLCIAAGVTVLALGWLYRLLFCPLELLRTPEEVGYIAEDGRTKARAANEMRRRREAGDLPPVYPNGWYRVLDSHMLARGEVKNIYILGMGQLLILEQFNYAVNLPAFHHVLLSLQGGLFDHRCYFGVWNEKAFKDGARLSCLCRIM